jgi:hypothetical protein
VFLDGAPQITTDPRFTRHLGADGTVEWNAVLDEPGWSSGQRLLIRLAAALSGNQQMPSDALGANLTGRQTDLVLAMCQAAHDGPPPIPDGAGEPVAG